LIFDHLLARENTMRVTTICTVPLVAALAFPSTAFAAPPDSSADAKIISEATGGKLKATQGEYFDKYCGPVDYGAAVVDLNGDGRPEVFTNLYGSCYGMAGRQMDLYIKDTRGEWKSQFGFNGEPIMLKTKRMGYPDILIAGSCLPVWRWNGQKYDAIYIHCGKPP